MDTLKQIGLVAKYTLLPVVKSPAFWSFAALVAACVYVCR